MFFSINKIKGRKYQYVGDNLYIAKGRTRVKVKSLGRVEGPLDQRIKRVENFVDELIEAETKERLKYWSPKIENPKGFVFDLEKLEKLRSRLYRGKERLSDLGKGMMEAAFKTDFIYNSNKIEGSKVPLEVIEKMVKQGGKLNEEVLNSLEALAYVKEKKRISSIRGLVELHKRLLEHEPSNHGIRKEPIMVFKSTTLAPKEIRNELKELFKWLNQKNHSMYPPELAFTFYYRFERIHPFRDGNGRIGRILMNAILKEHRYHPIIIWNSNRRAHMNAFEKAMEGGFHKYLMFMAEQMEKTYKVYTEKIRKAHRITRDLAETFFSPSA